MSKELISQLRSEFKIEGWRALDDAANLIESQAAALKTAEDLIAKRDAEIAELEDAIAYERGQR